MNIETAIEKAFCTSVKTQKVPAGIAVGTGFMTSGGDGISFYVVKSGGGFRIEDDGTTIPFLEGAGINLSKGSRAKAFLRLMSEYGVEYSEDDGELRTGILSEAEVPAAAMKFTALMLRVQDFSLLHPENVQSTFKEDAIREIERAFDGHAEILLDSPIVDELSLYPADIVLRTPKGPPLGVFLASSDKRALEAVVARMLARHEIRTDCRVMALVESPASLTGMGLERAMNGLDGLAMFRGARQASMNRIADLLPVRLN
ncbi:MAG: hypothetical protein VR70_06010 [Rhodospirillaceae bacterium BRH_c57]|nr:MAG: hypothetical protein VR70_06010 [Rhodospirillaceae bacterium BRH_c57]